MKLGENIYVKSPTDVEKPPIDDDPPPEYCSTIDLQLYDTYPEKVAPAPDSVSVHSVKCESKNPRRRRLLKIFIIVAVVSLLAILAGFAIKFAVHDDSGDDGLQVYNVRVRNRTGDYMIAVAASDERRVAAFRDNRRSACFLYFPQEHHRRFHKDVLGDTDDGKSSATVTYTTRKESGYKLALRVIREPVSSRTIEATAGTLIAEFCGTQKGFFLESIYGSQGREKRSLFDDDDDDDDGQRHDNYNNHESWWHDNDNSDESRQHQDGDRDESRQREDDDSDQNRQPENDDNDETENNDDKKQKNDDGNQTTKSPNQQNNGQEENNDNEDNDGGNHMSEHQKQRGDDRSNQHGEHHGQRRILIVL